MVIRSHVAAAGIGTFRAPLVDRQPVATAIGAAARARIACIHRGTS